VGVPGFGGVVQLSVVPETQKHPTHKKVLLSPSDLSTKNFENDCDVK
jgi:hypothetical protein